MRSQIMLMRVLMITSLIAVTCGPTPATIPGPPPPSPASAPATMLLDKAKLLATGVPEAFVRRLEASRFSYFRMLAAEFEARTCDAFRDIAAAIPTTAVQGDAHVEQFAVTADSYGLDDFDRGGFGPAVVDLVRYAASLHVTCSEVPWRCDPDAAVERFLTAYRATLIADLVIRPPSVVQRLRAKAPSTRALWLAGIDSQVVPFAPAFEADVRRGWAPFARLMRDVHPDWTEPALGIVRLGRIRIGVGSAVERKVLIRIAGPTDKPDDDELVEGREGAMPDPRSCVWRAEYGEPPMLTVMSYVGRRMPELHGFAMIPGSKRPYWLQSWDPRYVELSVADVTSQAELNELATDAAQQLAKPIWNRAPEQLRRHQRYAHATAFDVTRPRVIELARTLAAESVVAWEQFRAPAKTR